MEIIVKLLKTIAISFHKSKLTVIEKKLTVSRKKAKILTVNRKSHYPTETLLMQCQLFNGLDCFSPCAFV